MPYRATVIRHHFVLAITPGQVIYPIPRDWQHVVQVKVNNQTIPVKLVDRDGPAIDISRAKNKNKGEISVFVDTN